ncbi:hypothetical protein NEOLEDRAFT_348169 [Neolentinus lepideus HHB14362 ss-1]|uniref:Fungal-type protein kinase domain-containing protein n=1 Tax=Neolentinus lepideus HHB14362 ss-1 TaxID=1314782 RepID=A0A165SQU4_9AGAM|nr:hypothetical protein NEOLEDRAFT_348169 [Neolentinus lepideus HHB14362 ss-1]
MRPSSVEVDNTDFYLGTSSTGPVVLRRWRPKHSEAYVQGFKKDGHLWTILSYYVRIPNIVPLHGLHGRTGSPLAIIIPAYSQGNAAVNFMTSFGAILRILCGVAKALAYMYTRSIAHGSIRGVGAIPSVFTSTS